MNFYLALKTYKLPCGILYAVFEGEDVVDFDVVELLSLINR